MKKLGLLLAMAAALVIAGCSNGTSSGDAGTTTSVTNDSKASKTIRTAIDAIDGGDLAKAKSICDDLVDNDWDSLGIYDKCDIAYCYARTLGPLGPSATDIDRFRRCLESVSAKDRDAAARYVEETYAADLLTLEDLEGVLNVVETSARYKATGEL